MIVRIVTMHFKADAIDTFKAIFEEKKERIRTQPGCELLELYQDVEDPQRFYTYSYWQDEQSLNAYLHSDLFKDVWPRTKALFDQAPEARSVTKIHSLL